MGLRVNTNIQSIAAQRNLGMNNANTKKSLERLGSGSRIYRAADDAAGLAIAEKMKAQIRSVRQDIRNANDGVSMVQVAEGSLNEISNILVRFRELSVQAASDTNSDVERGFIDREVQALKGEVDRISASTEFNGIKLLTGERTEPLEIQVGTGNNAKTDRFVFETESLVTTLEVLGMADSSVKTKQNAQQNLEKVDEALNRLSGNRAQLGAFQNRLESTISSLNIYDENLSASKSRIYDLDVAAESSELVKNNILSNFGTSVLSQANQNSMLALKLI
jgi:flagellin